MSPNDITEEQLTAFALDELEGRDRERIASVVLNDPAALRQVEQIRATGLLLSDAFAHEPLVELAKTAAIPSRVDKPRRVSPLVLWTAIAAGVVIVCGTVAIMLPSLNRSREVALYRATTDSERPASTPPAPQRALARANSNSAGTSGSWGLGSSTASACSRSVTARVYWPSPSRATPRSPSEVAVRRITGEVEDEVNDPIARVDVTVALFSPCFLGPLEGASEHGLTRWQLGERVRRDHLAAYEALFGHWPAAWPRAAVFFFCSPC